MIQLGFSAGRGAQDHHAIGLEQTPAAAAFRRALMPLSVSSRAVAMWRSSGCAEDHHKSDDHNHGPSRAQSDGLRDCQRRAAAAKVTAIPVALGSGVAGRLGWLMAPN